jgi:filamentous hemagglutinin family protein
MMESAYQWRLQVSIALFLNTIAVTFGLNAQAQIIPDTSPAGTTNSQISGGLISGGITRGTNLFHSFREFNVGGVPIYFDNLNTINNIFARVIDKESRIDGTLGARGNANLFLINPNGISFGINAKLDIGGSFLASTASSILFPGGSFSASTPITPPILDIQTQAPIGLQFEGKPNSIIVKEVGGYNPGERYLSVLPGNNLTLVGGDIEIFGKGGNNDIVTLQAPNGKISLVSISEIGTVKISNGNLAIPDGLRRGNILLRNGALLKTENQGSTSLYANNITLTAVSKILGNLAANAFQKIQIEGGSNLNGENIALNSTTLNITGGAAIKSDYLIAKILEKIQIEGGSELDGKNIMLDSKTLNITGGAKIKGDYMTTKVLGNVQIEEESELKIGKRFELVSKSLRITDIKYIKDVKEDSIFLGDAQIDVSDDINLLRGRVNGNSITLKSGSLSLDDASKFVTGATPSGDVGNIFFRVGGEVLLKGGSSLFTGVPPQGKGNAGSITIISNSLKVEGKSEINSSQSSEINSRQPKTENIYLEAGNIYLEANGNISFLGESRVYSSLSEKSKGRGGDITIRSGSLDILGASQLNASLSGAGTPDNNGIAGKTGMAGNIDLKVRGLTKLDGAKGKDTSSLLATVNFGGTGNPGNVIINTGSLAVQNSAQIVNGNSGKGVTSPGKIEINAQDRVDLVGGGGIRGGIDIRAEGASSGSVTINTRSLLIDNGSQIELKNFGTAQETGTIVINASDSVTIDGSKNPKFETGVITDVQGGAVGTAGNIILQTPKLFLTDSGRITASTASGNGGNVTLKDIRLLLLRRNSQISATVKQGNGDGGNISIDAPNGFVIAVPSEKSFITANALLDSGGKITINAKAIFGLARPSRANLVKYFSNRLGKNNSFGKAPGDVTRDDLSLPLPISAITAISQENAALDGQVTLNAPINPNQGINQVPRKPRSTVVADSCQVSNGKESVRFFDIGRGGLPPRPEDPLSVDLLEWTSVPEIAGQPNSSLFMPQTKSGIDVNLPDRASRSFQTSSTYLKLLPPCQSR